MAFDWKSFLATHGVEYVTRGPNIGRDQVGVQCPFCGPSDPSQHMCINLKSGSWGWCCRRNRSHRGKSRAKLIRAMLRCSEERALELADESARALPPDEDISRVVWEMLGQGEPRRKELKWSPDFVPLRPDRVSAAPFVKYLERRGYTYEDVLWLSRNYRLHYAKFGPFRSRLIIPVHTASGDVVAWTGRTILPETQPRYKASTDHPPGEWLLGLPLLWSVKNPKALLLCEGPLDAMRVSCLGRDRGIYGTCLFGLTLSPNQAALIRDLRRRFSMIAWLLDDDAELLAVSLQRSLDMTCPRLHLPEGFKDPGDLTEEAADKLLESVSKQIS